MSPFEEKDLRENGEVLASWNPKGDGETVRD